ncbi:hypothetical protein [Brevibacillus dissolubilis]|uniref:hypothetical protein n=1 Tax=Brevibacillus dissolubilis TaxID=1844116 RepID=UPI001115B84D|nr:hypothetical protein [Brevibacillus dissolubilis]
MSNDRKEHAVKMWEAQQKRAQQASSNSVVSSVSCDTCDDTPCVPVVFGTSQAVLPEGFVLLGSIDEHHPLSYGYDLSCQVENCRLPAKVISPCTGIPIANAFTTVKRVRYVGSITHIANTPIVFSGLTDFSLLGGYARVSSTDTTEVNNVICYSAAESPCPESFAESVMGFATITGLTEQSNGETTVDLRSTFLLPPCNGQPFGFDITLTSDGVFLCQPGTGEISSTTLSGRVVDFNGNPVPGLPVVIALPNTLRGDVDQPFVFTDEDGNYSFTYQTKVFGNLVACFQIFAMTPFAISEPLDICIEPCGA